MRPGGGKQKGAQFERGVCAHLSRWVTNGESESCFWRSAMSGGRATVRFAKGKSADGHGGDITATDPRAHPLLDVFTVECKHVADLNLRAAMICGNGDLVKHWQQVVGDAQRVSKRPLLIAKQNRFPTLLLLRHSDATTYFGMISQQEVARLFLLEGYRISMFIFEQFLEALPYDAKRFQPHPAIRVRPTRPA